MEVHLQEPGEAPCQSDVPAFADASAATTERASWYTSDHVMSAAGHSHLPGGREAASAIGTPRIA
jgi:hypothetical protein